MSLAELQQAIAELICDDKSLQDYRADPASWTSARRLGDQARLLVGIDHDSLRAFHDIHARDRAYFLEATLPLTIRRLGAGWSTAFFERHPYGDDDLQAEAARFLLHLRDSTKDKALLALARYEIARSRLLYEPPFTPRPYSGGQRGRLEAGPGIAILPMDVHLPSLVDDPTRPARSCEGVALLRRDEDDVTSAWLEGTTARLLRAVLAKDKQRIREITSDEEGRRAFVAILVDGVIR